MAAINDACSILRNPVRRAAWDRINLRILDKVGSQPADGRPVPGADAGPAGAPVADPGPATWRRGPFGEGAAGPPPGPRRGSVLPFGRHIGWSLGEIARVDPGYLVWLRERHEGEPYRAEIDRCSGRCTRPRRRHRHTPVTVASSSAEPDASAVRRSRDPRHPQPPASRPRSPRGTPRSGRGRPRGPEAARGPASATSRAGPAPASASRPRGGPAGRTGPTSPSTAAPAPRSEASGRSGPPPSPERPGDGADRRGRRAPRSGALAPPSVRPTPAADSEATRPPNECPPTTTPGSSGTCASNAATASSAFRRGRVSACASYPRARRPSTQGAIEAALPAAPWPR